MNNGNVATRIDIAVNEHGASALVRQLNQLADASQKLSPTLAASLRGRALRLGVNLERVVKDAAKAILFTVVKATPHDTGQARGNWQVAVRIGRPLNTPLYGKLDYEGDSTIADGRALIDLARRNPGQTIYISNSLPYIKRLNEGWSQQAAAGFVERAVQAGAASVRSGSKKLFE